MAAHPWPLRHVTKLSIGVGLLLLADSYTTQLLVDGQDPDFEYAAGDDTPEAYRRYVEHGGKREKAEAELARLHARVAKRLADRGALRTNGLDPLLAVLRERVDERVRIDAETLVVDEASFGTLEINALAGASLVDVRDVLPRQEYSCASGLSKAFEDAIGAGVVVFDALDQPGPGAPRVSLSWSARANGRFYSGHGGTKLFPGIEVTATLRLDADGRELASLQTTVEPGPDIAFTQFGGTGFLGPDPSAVAGGMIEGACTRLGEAWIDELTGLAPPVLAPRDTPTESCSGGDAQACIALGEDLRESDPAAALEKFQMGCRSSGLGIGAACLATAELALEIGGEDAWATAMIALDNGCDANDGIACLRAADSRIARGHGDPVFLAEVYALRLRACDLGAAQGCMLASTTALDASAPVRARLLAARACAGGVDDGCDRVETLKGAVERTIHEVALETSDTAFDVRWGMWFEHSPAEVTWFATNASTVALEDRFAEPIARGRVRVFAPGDVPPGVRTPADAVAIFGIASPPRIVIGEPRQCPKCSREAQANMFWPIGCTCLPG